MTQRSEERLQRALQDLQGVQASPGFTDRVLEGLARRKARRRLRNQLTISAAAATVLAIVVSAIVVNQSSEITREELALEARQLRQEHAQLRSDLEDLSASARDAAPVLYLGGDDDFDLVLDLAPIIGQTAPVAATTTNTTDPYEL
jgi:hypothetical protein